jgi:DtxR family Mn-dependent transcriptional regulator
MPELSKSMEQYLEAIYDLQREYGAASVTDIASDREVKSPSVTYVLRKLKSLGLVNYKRYRSVTLTEQGREIAEKLERTHKTLRWFLEMIGVSPEIADEDACEIEHLVHRETVEKLAQFVDWMKNTKKGAQCLQAFHSSEA